MPSNYEQELVPIILCGGSGTRLWPLSRNSYPKQFVNLVENSKISLLQETIKRIEKFNNITEPIIVCNEEHRFLVAEQCKEINIKPKDIILEPLGMNTAPAILSAAIRVFEENKKANLLILSSDQIMSNTEQFKLAVEKGENHINNGKIVLFGVLPTSPETGYGYINVEKIPNLKKLDAEKILRFIEKPNLKIAKE